MCTPPMIRLSAIRATGSTPEVAGHQAQAEPQGLVAPVYTLPNLKDRNRTMQLADSTLRLTGWPSVLANTPRQHPAPDWLAENAG